MKYLHMGMPIFCGFFFFKQKTAYEIMPSLVGSEMCIRDRLWSDQCFDAVACEGPRSIRPTWMLCLEILNVDWTLIGSGRDAVGYCIT